MTNNTATTFNPTVPQVPTTTAAAQQTKTNNAAFAQVVSTIAAAGTNVATGGFGGAAVGNLVNGLLGGSGTAGVDPSFQANLDAQTAMSEKLMNEQLAMNNLSQTYTASSNIQQSSHDAAMSVIRNIKA